MKKIEELLPPVPKPKPKYKIERFRVDMVFDKEDVGKSIAKFLKKKEGVLSMETVKKDGKYIQITMKTTEDFVKKTILTSAGKIIEHPNFTLLSIADLFKLRVGT